MSIKKIILHVGLVKTGTTSIQDTLYFNKKYLEENRFLYLPSDTPEHNQFLINMFSVKPRTDYHGNMWSNLTEKDIQEYVSLHKHKLLDIINNSNCETLIISGEDTDLLYQEDIYKMRDYFSEYPGIELKIIIYVRQPVQLLTSLYQHDALLRNKEEQDEYIKVFAHKIFDFHVKKFVTVFQDNVTILQFEESIQDPYGPTGHFLKQIGFPTHLISNIIAIRSNESRCQEVTEFIFALSKAHPRYIYANGKKKFNPDRIDSDVGPLFRVIGQKFDLPYDYKMELFALAQNSIGWLKETTGYDYSTPPRPNQEEALYQEETIQGLISAFEFLTPLVQKFFLEYYEQEYILTKKEKFKRLYAKGSIPWQKHLIHKPIEYWNQSDIPQNGRALYESLAPKWQFDYIQLYVDYNGKDIFTPDHSFCFNQNHNEMYSFCIHFSEKDNIRAIRIDPSIYACIVTVNKLIINHQKVNDLKCGNFDCRIENTFAFFRDDPQFYLPCEYPIISIEFEAIVDTGSFSYARLNTLWLAHVFNMVNHLEKKGERLSQQIHSIEDQKSQLSKTVALKEEALQSSYEEKNQLLLQIDLRNEENKELENKIHMQEKVKNQLLHQIDIQEFELNVRANTIQEMHNTEIQLKAYISTLQNMYESLINSTSWKITKPIRYVFDRIKSFLKLIAKS